MAPSHRQCAEFRDRSWTLVEQAFSPEEIAALEAAALEVLERAGPEAAREADGSPHACWGMHLFHERLGMPARHPLLLEPAEALLGGQVYVHQSRINRGETFARPEFQAARDFSPLTPLPAGRLLG